ncbi:MAG: Urocanate reductase precursor [Syntrophaceae bacterium PtaU1.Bin231]|nr:MAG: Urocanate reductase precursor [Syntrophaceae bacterium PtaU1.Bin231]
MNIDEKKKGDSPAARGISRREFIATAGAAAAGTMAAGALLPGKVEAVPPPKRWDRTTDVLIVGTGYAGLAAAIEARDAGAQVAIIEKTPVIGGNSVIASGIYNCSEPEVQAKYGIKDSPELHYQQTLAAGDYRGDPEKVRFMTSNALAGRKWLEKLGVVFDPKPYTAVGALWARSFDPVNKGRGGLIIKVLKEQVDKRKIPILMNVKLAAIVRQKTLDGPVMGALVVDRKKEIYIRARRAVILATGGFSADVAMRMKHDPRLNAEVPTTNVATATGEAITIAANEGADVIGMDYIQMLIACNYYTKKYGSLTNLGVDHALFVNLEGKRFVAEDARRDVMAEGVLKQPKKVLLWVADEQCAKRFNPKITEEILKDGLAFRANTLEELAKQLNEKLQVPEKAFLDTVAQYNDAVAKGKDAEFGKKPANLKPVTVGPFYASPTQAGVHHTMGGIQTKGTTCQVIGRNDKIIPRLYAAGEVTGGVHGTNRVGGNATVDCIVFGRNAGMNAAKEKPLA